MERDKCTEGVLFHYCSKLPRRTVVLNVRYDTCKFCLNFAVSICISETYFGLPIFRYRKEKQKEQLSRLLRCCSEISRESTATAHCSYKGSLINLPVGKDKDKAAAGSIALRSGQRGETERKRKTVPNRRREFRNYCLSSTQLSPSLTFPYLRNDSRREKERREKGCSNRG